LEIGAHRSAVNAGSDIGMLERQVCLNAEGVIE